MKIGDIVVVHMHMSRQCDGYFKVIEVDKYNSLKCIKVLDGEGNNIFPDAGHYPASDTGYEEWINQEEATLASEHLKEEMKRLYDHSAQIFALQCGAFDVIKSPGMSIVEEVITDNPARHMNNL